MHIDKLKIFIDLIENKSFSKAAKLNSITQSAVSQQVQALERLINVTIIDRSQKSFQLTKAGGVFYRTAKDINTRFDSMLSELKEQ